VSQSTVAKYMRRHPRPPSQTWRTFLTNHAGQILTADLFVVPTVTFRLLFVLVILAQNRRRIIHADVTAHPTAGWIAQQLRNAFPADQWPRYLVHDRDGAVRRAEPVREFALLKIARDIQRPALFGGERVPIAAGVSGLDSTLSLSFQVMEVAARCMLQVDNGEPALQPDCALSAITDSEPSLRDHTDAVGLFLNSLLVPAQPRAALMPVRVKFAHRAYQE
jgi:hypothetical protein